MHTTRTGDGLWAPGLSADTSVTVVLRAGPLVSQLARRAAGALTVWLVCVGSAQAQIYTWVDTNGSLVVSNVPQGTNLGIPSYEVPKASPEIRATRRVDRTRSTSYDDLIETHAARQGIRSDLVRAVIQVESAFNPRARSNKGAMGLMQLMPATARQFGVSNAFDPGENVRGGVEYLRQLLDKYNGNERLALAAYNAGPGNVDRYGQTVPPFRETRDYVSRIRGLAGTRAPVSRPTASSDTATTIFRTVDVIDGREVVHYSDQAPSR